MNYRDRLEFGNYYHICNRGNNIEALFKEDRNYKYFLELFKKYLSPIVHLYAYCLLPTHFHLLVRIKDYKSIEHCIHDENQIWMQFRTFLATYTKAINKIYRRSGHIFEGSYSRKVVLEDEYFFQLIAYIHQNPQNHGIVADYRNWPFSSFSAYKKMDRRSIVSKEVFFNQDLYNTIIEVHDLEASCKFQEILS